MWQYNGDHLAHHGIKGQQWGIRRYQNEDGTLTEEGKRRYQEDADKYRKELDERATRYKDQSQFGKNVKLTAKELKDADDLYKQEVKEGTKKVKAATMQAAADYQRLQQSVFLIQTLRNRRIAQESIKKMAEVTKEVSDQWATTSMQYVNTLADGKRDAAAAYLTKLLESDLEVNEMNNGFKR